MKRIYLYHYCSMIQLSPGVVQNAHGTIETTYQLSSKKEFDDATNLIKKISGVEVNDQRFIITSLTLLNPIDRIDAEPVAEIIECPVMGQQTVAEIEGRWKFLRIGDLLYTR